MPWHRLTWLKNLIGQGVSEQSKAIGWFVLPRIQSVCWLPKQHHNLSLFRPDYCKKHWVVFDTLAAEFLTIIVIREWWSTAYAACHFPLHQGESGDRPQFHILEWSFCFRECNQTSGSSVMICLQLFMSLVVSVNSVFAFFPTSLCPCLLFGAHPMQSWVSQAANNTSQTVRTIHQRGSL